jgi:hypothetical protein
MLNTEHLRDSESMGSHTKQGLRVQTIVHLFILAVIVIVDDNDKSVYMGHVISKKNSRWQFCSIGVS